MRKIVIIPVISLLILWYSVSYGAFVSGSTGADGAFNPTANTVVTLPPDGVLNYTTIYIPAGVTVTFQKNAANTPVYMFATGDVTIDGIIRVNGTAGTSNDIGKGGNGGFDGGYGGQIADWGGRGIGPGGGSGGWVDNYGTGGGGGGFGTNGINGGVSYNNVRNVAGGGTYGNARLLPIIGGSGGGGGGGMPNGTIGCAGGGGGGAILIASSGSINITGQVTAQGGNGPPCGNTGGGGSGGSIKLMANTISGNGTISAIGGIAYNQGGNGGKGRIRFESFVNYRSAVTDPPYSYGTPGSVLVSNLPTLTITSIGGTVAPASPTGNYNQPDITLPSGTSSAAVNITAKNIPIGTAVKVWVIPQYGNATWVDAATLSGTQQESTTSATVTSLSTTYSNVVTAEATFTVTAMYYNGEEINKVRVATRMGGKSETTYITKSGKEIKGELLASLK